MSKDLSLTISGPDVSPDTVPLSDLIELLRNLQIAIAATARSSGADKEDVQISLVSVAAGSNKLSFAASSQVTAQARKIISAIKSDDPSKLPPRSRKAVRDLWKRSANKGWQIELSANIAGKVRSATIAPALEPFRSSRANGSTTQLVYVLRVGNEHPTAQLRLPNNRQITAKVSGKAVAEQLGHNLYQWVEVTGDAQWNTKTWHLEEFNIKSIGSYKQRTSDPVKALAKLTELSAGKWEDVDPQAFVQEMRSDD